MKLITSSFYNGYQVNSKHGGLVENILIGNEQLVRKALFNHKRTCVFRFELKFPESYSGEFDVISKFFDSLRVKIQADLTDKTWTRRRTVHSELGYIWVKELSSGQGWHYHIAMFVNYDVYNCFGDLNTDKKNMHTRIRYSWANALGIPKEDAKGLVHVPKNAIYALN